MKYPMKPRVTAQIVREQGIKMDKEHKQNGQAPQALHWHDS
jgi:hypothetical protein